jgi:peptide/bleomycin uptake transporter
MKILLRRKHLPVECAQFTVFKERAEMIKTFFWSPRYALWAYGGGAFLLGSLYWQVQMLVWLNDWRGGFYDMWQHVERHTSADFERFIWDFAYIAAKYVILAVITSYATQLYAFKWRTAINNDYIPRWIASVGHIEGASQRLQEDTRDFGKIVESLGLQVAKALMTLFEFLPLLGTLSATIVMSTGTQLDNIPYVLSVVAFVAALGGFGISWLVGIKLRDLQYNNQKVEAAYRLKLGFSEQDRTSLTLQIATDLFTEIKINYYRLYRHTMYFNLWANVYGQFMMIVPYLIAGPSVFAGAISLGVLMKISNAFSQVHNSFDIFTNNWMAITELRSIRKRLREFQKFLPKTA